MDLVISASRSFDWHEPFGRQNSTSAFASERPLTETCGTSEAAQRKWEAFADFLGLRRRPGRARVNVEAAWAAAGMEEVSEMPHGFRDARGTYVNVCRLDVTHTARLIFGECTIGGTRYILFFGAFDSTHGRRQDDYKPDQRAWNNWRTQQGF